MYVLTPLMGRLAHRTGAMDTPTDDRRMHELATPLLGGLALYLGWMVPVMLLVEVDRPVWGIIGGATIVVAVGLFDDLYELEPIVKFIGQLLAIGVAIYFDTRMTRIGVPFTEELTWQLPLVASVLVTGFWMAMIINMVNFIDGLDGLAAGVAAIAAISLFALAAESNQPVAAFMAVVIVGVCIGFLRYNFHPASIFMGDSGSLLLGFALACISLTGVMKSVAAIALVVPILIVGVPVFDTLSAIIRRKRHGRPIGEADKGHIHHRLLARGFSQRQTVLIIYVWSAALAIGGYAMRWAPVLYKFVTFVVLALLSGLMAYWLGLFEAAHHEE